MWLLKTEPGGYSGAGPEEGGRARGGRAGGPAGCAYHAGDEKAVVGVAEVVKPAYPDPKFPEGKLLVVDIEARGKLGRPVTLAEIKALGEFEDSPLVRMGRLSVVPLTASQWKAIEALCKAWGGAGAGSRPGAPAGGRGGS